jgi:hypothetical protein
VATDLRVRESAFEGVTAPIKHSGWSSFAIAGGSRYEKESRSSPGSATRVSV